jgi:hypothetical protein
MKSIFHLIGAFMFSVTTSAISQELNYSHAIQLDAEALAEQGMAERYVSVQPALKAYGVVPLMLTENLDSEKGLYSVTIGSDTQQITPSPLGGGEGESWGVATAVFFEFVNRQLAQAPVKFYALNAGNDLMGIFLTESQVAMAKKNIKRPSDWPYLPKMQAPWFGQYH